MNSRQVKDKLKNLSKERNIQFNVLLKYYVFERFIIRLSKSEYKDNFILKGGYLLSQLFGLNNRTTSDIDSSLNKSDLTEENVLKMVDSIIQIDLKDNVVFTIKDIRTIRNEDEYGGYRVSLLFHIENVKDIIHLDIATGDPITPREILLTYKSMLEDEDIQIWSYPEETILAEKMETIFSKLEANSRIKYYYDVYLIFVNRWATLDKRIFKDACKKTFEKRNFKDDLSEAIEIIRNSLILRNYWKTYSQKNNIKNLDFDEILACIKQITDVLEPVKD